MVVNLKNKPLIEAIFEIRWKIQHSDQSISDLDNQLMLGRLFDRISSTYPKYERLFPFADIPEQMAEGILKHRFRTEAGWPLVQVGTGILTVNDTENYLWQNFKPKVIDVINNLYDIYPNNKQIEPQSIILKYIDAIDIDASDDIYSFLKNKMKLNICIDDSMFKKTSIHNKPIHLDIKFVFNCDRPKGTIHFHLFQGKKSDNSGNITDALIWETVIQSNNSDIPEISLNLEQWLEDAHQILHDWFFTLVEGDLLRSFE